jgi:hypothetical protein
MKEMKYGLVTLEVPSPRELPLDALTPTAGETFDKVCGQVEMHKE